MKFKSVIVLAASLSLLAGNASAGHKEKSQRYEKNRGQSNQLKVKKSDEEFSEIDFEYKSTWYNLTKLSKQPGELFEYFMIDDFRKVLLENQLFALKCKYNVKKHRFQRVYITKKHRNRAVICKNPSEFEGIKIESL